MIRVFVTALLLVLSACAKTDASNSIDEGDAQASPSKKASAEILGIDGKRLGLVFLQETPNGVILSASFKGVPEGEHAFHIHSIGS